MRNKFNPTQALQSALVPKPELPVQLMPAIQHQANVAPAEPIPVTVQPAQATAEKTAILSSYYDKWTWEKSLIHKVQYNKHIQAWMDHSPEFYNWVRSCIMFHADNGCDETRCTIPDQWREDIGDSITIVTANYIPVRQGTTHISKAGVYHVMN